MHTYILFATHVGRHAGLHPGGVRAEDVRGRGISLFVLVYNIYYFFIMLGFFCLLCLFSL